MSTDSKITTRRTSRSLGSHPGLRNIDPTIYVVTRKRHRDTANLSATGETLPSPIPHSLANITTSPSASSQSVSDQPIGQTNISAIEAADEKAKELRDMLL